MSKRFAHILLALVAGILLQASVLAIGAQHADGSAKLGFRLADLGSAGALLDPDRPDAPQPYAGGPSPKPFAHTPGATAVLPPAGASAGRSAHHPSPISPLPVYLTTLRLRI